MTCVPLTRQSRSMCGLGLKIREQFNGLSGDYLVDLYGLPPTASSFDQRDFYQLRPVVEQIAKEEPDLLAPLGDPPSSAKLEISRKRPSFIAPSLRTEKRTSAQRSSGPTRGSRNGMTLRRLSGAAEPS